MMLTIACLLLIIALTLMLWGFRLAIWGPVLWAALVFGALAVARN